MFGVNLASWLIVCDGSNVYRKASLHINVNPLKVALDVTGSADNYSRPGQTFC